MPAFCFARTGSYELEVAGRKLVGSAQRRQGAGFLQHGSVMLGAAPDRLRRVFPDRSAIRSPGMTTLEAVLGRRPVVRRDHDRARRGLPRGARRSSRRAGGPRPARRSRCGRSSRDKYGTDRWTRSGRASRARPGPLILMPRSRASIRTRRGSAWARSSSTATACCWSGAASRRLRASGASPAGLVHLGERHRGRGAPRGGGGVRAAACSVLGLCGVIDRVVPGEHADSGRPRGPVSLRHHRLRRRRRSAASSGRAATPPMRAGFPSPSSAATKPPTGSPP